MSLAEGDAIATADLARLHQLVGALDGAFKDIVNAEYGGTD
jgi:hypothetical protein